MAKLKPKPDDKEQSKRFTAKAEEIAADDAEEVFEASLNVILPKQSGPEKK